MSRNGVEKRGEERNVGAKDERGKRVGFGLYVYAKNSPCTKAPAQCKGAGLCQVESWKAGKPSYMIAELNRTQ